MKLRGSERMFSKAMLTKGQTQSALHLQPHCQIESNNSSSNMQKNSPNQTIYTFKNEYSLVMQLPW